MNDRQINAFATLGGYIGVNAGLVLTAEREDEVAAVLSHEIAHVTQQHVLRGVERAQRDQIPILLGMLAAVVAAQASNSTSSGNATMAAISSGMGLMQQRQISYTRSNESEADRLGIRTLSRATTWMPWPASSNGCRRPCVATKGATACPSSCAPTRSTSPASAKPRPRRADEEGYGAADHQHPTGERKERVDPADPSLGEPLLRGNNPLLPSSVLRLPIGQLNRGAATSTGHVSACVLSADSTRAGTRVCRPGSGRRTVSTMRSAMARRWRSCAVAVRRPGPADPRPAPDPSRQPVAGAGPGRSGIAGRPGGPSQQPLRAAAARTPQQPPGGTDLCRDPERTGQPRGRPARAGDAAPLLSQSGNDRSSSSALPAPASWRRQRACQQAYAEAAFLSGRPEQALLQLQALKRNPALDYIGRARVDARIEAITPTVLELRRRACRTRTWTGAERCMTGRWQSRPVPGSHKHVIKP